MIQQILSAYAKQSRETRTDSGVAPLIEVAETTTTSHPDTPLTILTPIIPPPVKKPLLKKLLTKKLTLVK